MSPTKAESAMRSHVEAEYVDRLQRENATLRGALENERKFSAASRAAHSTAMSRLAAIRAAGNALARHVAEETRGQTARQLVEAWEEASR